MTNSGQARDDLAYVAGMVRRTDRASAMVGGLTYTLAGVHLERPLAWSGLLMLAAFVVMSLVDLPYLWTTIGFVIAASLAVTAFVEHNRGAATTE